MKRDKISPWRERTQDKTAVCVCARVLRWLHNSLLDSYRADYRDNKETCYFGELIWWIKIWWIKIHTLNLKYIQHPHKPTRSITDQMVFLKSININGVGSWWLHKCPFRVFHKTSEVIIQRKSASMAINFICMMSKYV